MYVCAACTIDADVFSFTRFYSSMNEGAHDVILVARHNWRFRIPFCNCIMPTNMKSKMQLGYDKNARRGLKHTRSFQGLSVQYARAQSSNTQSSESSSRCLKGSKILSTCNSNNQVQAACERTLQVVREGSRNICRRLALCWRWASFRDPTMCRRQLRLHH